MSGSEEVPACGAGDGRAVPGGGTRTGSGVRGSRERASPPAEPPLPAPGHDSVSPGRPVPPAAAAPTDDPLQRIIPPEPLAPLVVEYPEELVLRPVPPDGEVVVRFVVGIDVVTSEIAVFYRQPHYELQVNVTNVTNATWYRNGVNTGAFPGEPRAAFATLRVKL